jgi:hypothetical protein
MPIDAKKILSDLAAVDGLLAEWREGSTEPGRDILRDHLPDIIAAQRELVAYVEERAKTAAPTGIERVTVFVADLAMEMAKMRALLRDIEWRGDPDAPAGSVCPACRGYPIPAGKEASVARARAAGHRDLFEHAPDCRLALLLDLPRRPSPAHGCTTAAESAGPEK